MKLVHLFLMLVIVLIVSVVAIVQLYRGPLADLKREVTELEVRLSEKGEEKERAEGEIKEREKTLATKLEEVRQLENKIKAFDRDIAAKEKRMSALKRASSSKDETVQGLTSKLLLKEQEAQGAKLELSRMGEALEKLKEEDRAKSQIIEDLTGQLEKSSLANKLLTMKLENREAEMAELKVQIVELGERIEKLMGTSETAIEEGGSGLEGGMDSESLQDDLIEDWGVEIEQQVPPLENE
jgi:chromosome segregation ATPase